MKKWLSANPVLSASIIFILFFSLPQLTAFLSPNQLLYLSVTVAILTAATWFLYKAEGKNLSALGLNLSRRNIYFLLAGLVTGALLFFTLFILQMFHSGLKVKFNPNVNYTVLISGLFIMLLRVVIEELIFRGYCFTKTVDMAGIFKANIIFAFLFIVWHWFALNAWGNYGLMLGLFTTGFGHILFATALMKSKTLYFPIGIHLGNNWVSENIFSYQTKGAIDSGQANSSFFHIISPEQHFSKLHILISYSITVAVFLLFTFLILKWKKGRLL
jgi:membrane protease YdiL (CAAX protease family)